jgi:hypothetical protein
LLTREEKRLLKPQRGGVESVATNASRSVEVAWGWYDRAHGVVEWAFRNTDSREHQVILLRSSYYFGDAFWSIYSSNPSFHTSFMDGRVAASPLGETTVSENSAPLALVQFDGFPQVIVCFVFTLSGGQSWGMLEGGFGPSMEPSGMGVYDVSPLSGGEFCIAYDPQSVKEWDAQTQTRLRGYTPDPSTFNTWLFQAEGGATYRKLFSGDTAVSGRCPGPGAEPEKEKHQYEGGLFPAVFPGILSPPLNP